jgi:hypothetical protein
LSYLFVKEKEGIPGNQWAFSAFFSNWTFAFRKRSRLLVHQAGPAGGGMYTCQVERGVKGYILQGLSCSVACVKTERVCMKGYCLPGVAIHGHFIEEKIQS